MSASQSQALQMLTLTTTLHNRVLTNEVCTHLDDKSMVTLFNTCKHFALFSKGANSIPKLIRKRNQRFQRDIQRATELLSCVLNISQVNRDRISTLICSESKVELDSIILMRVTAAEFFFGTDICKKVRSNESPLEAAARNGDNPIVSTAIEN